MAITKVINDAVDLNQTSDYSGLRLPVGTTGNVVESFTTDYLVVGGGGGTQSGGGSNYPGGGGAGGLRTSYNNSTTTTNSLSFPSGKTAIATYMLDNNANDISGNYNGTATNITYNTGKYGGAAVFNGSNSSISITDAGIGNNATARVTFSVSIWVKTTSTSAAAIVSDYDAADYAFYLQMNANGTLNIGNYFDGVGSFTSGTATINDGNWHNLVLINNTSDNTQKLFVDGNNTPDINHTLTSGTKNAVAVQVGYYASAGGYVWNGSIDQVRFYNIALGSSDISNIYSNEVQALSGGGSAAESSLTLSEGVAYDVTVGGATTTGEDSTFSTITASGGGKSGGPYASAFGSSGGSGGGASGDAYSAAGGNGTLNQGYAGGSSGPVCSGSSCRYPGGGGGGAAGIGENATTTTAGNGGNGIEVNIIGGTGNYYAGGGGGSSYLSGAAIGGLGGGGNGSARLSGSEVVNDGASNTGGGGGGGLVTSSTPALGGSGVVILRYPTASVSSFTTTGTLNTPSTTDTLANNNYPATNTAYYTLDGNANGYLTTNDLGTLNYPSGTGCIALYELDGNANGYLTTTDLSTVNYPAGAGCIALYELNGNPNDTSGTYTGTANSISYVTGAFNQGIAFSGANSNVETNLANSNFTSNYSISFWVNLTNANAFQNFTGNYKSAGGYGGFTFMCRSNGGTYRFGFIWWTGSGGNYNFVDNLDVVATSGTWVHLLVTKASSTLPKLYVNGTANSLFYDNSATDHGTTTENFKIGNTLNSNYSAGKIDQVRVFNTELSASDATTLARGIATSYSGQESNITYNTGAFGKAAIFNGSSSKITVPDSSDNLNFSNHIGTISAWVNFNSFSNEPIVCKRGTGNPGARSYIFAVTTGGVIQWYTYNTDSNAQNVSSTSTISTNRWYHLAVTLDQTNIKIYIDGVLDTTASSTYTSIQDDGADFTIGYRGKNSGFNYADGSIDQVRIFNTALSAPNIATLARGAGTAYNGAESNIIWRGGKFNKAAMFDGSRSEITVNSFASLTQVGISMWVNMSDISQQAVLISRYGSTREFAIYMYGGDLIASIYYNGNNGNATEITTSTYMSNDTWHHIAYTANGSTAPKLYIDAVEVGTPQWTDPAKCTYYTSSEPLDIGHGFGLAAYDYEGKIDQIRIFPTALTLSNVTDLYNEHYQTKFTDGSDTAIMFTEGTGTITFDGTNPPAPQGALRTNTSYSEDGSASVIEHYNGTAWKRFDATKYCTTNTLNFPAGTGCIASYNLDNNVDDIGNTYNGTNSNVTFNASGKFGACGVFNGSNSYITVPTLSGFTNYNFTMSFWFNSTSTAAQYFMDFRNPIYMEFGYDLGSGAYNNTYSFIIYTGTQYAIHSSANLRDGNWHHIAVTYDGVTLKMYIDNATPITSTINDNTQYAGSGNAIGATPSGTAIFDGSMDQIRIFNTALTSTQIDDLYTNEIACS